MDETIKTQVASPVHDEILQECWRIKDELSAKYGTDIARLFEDMRAQRPKWEAAGFKYVDLSKQNKSVA